MSQVADTLCSCLCLKDQIFIINGSRKTLSCNSLRAFVWFLMTHASILHLCFHEGSRGIFNSPDSALTPPLAALGKKPPLPYYPW